VPYGRALELQAETLASRREGRCPDRLLLLEHPPVVTQGRSAKPENLLRSPAELATLGVELHSVARGGDVTFHAPGQLVGYPIIDLGARNARDVHWFLRGLEAALIATLAELEVPATRLDGMTGVYVDLAASARPDGPERKIASIGIGVRHWITCHGFALNVSLDLAGFQVIVPCGLEAVEMTSVARERHFQGLPSIPCLDARAREIAAAAFRRWLAA